MPVSGALLARCLDHFHNIRLHGFQEVVLCMYHYNEIFRNLMHAEGTLVAQNLLSWWVECVRS